MKITQETTFAAVPDDRNLISSACAVVESDGNLVLIVNVKDRRTEQICSSSCSDGEVSYTFADPDTDYNLLTEVKFTPENDREKALLKGNRFDQYERGQFVFKFLPWVSCTESEVLGLLENT